FTTWVIYVNIAIYATCYQIQRPLEPFLVEQLKKQQADGGDGAVEYARLQSFFSIMQTVGSLLSGRLLDKFGVKGGFVLSFLASAMCYGILSQAHSMELLYYSKIPTIFQAGFLSAQAAISQFTADGPDRAKALGMLTMSYTVGSVLGPTIGGLIGASGDYYFGAKIAVVGSLLSIVLTVLFIHDEKPKKTENGEKTQDNQVTNPCQPESTLTIYEAILRAVWVLLASKVISSVANAMHQAIFPLVLKNQFGFTEKALGMTMSASSFLNAIVNGIFLGQLVDLFHGELSSLISYCVFGLVATAVLQGICALPTFVLIHPTLSVYSYLGACYLASTCQFVLGTTLTGESTSLVKNEHKGSLLGLEHALFAFARVGAPQVGVYVLLALGEYGLTGVSLVMAGIYEVVLLLLQFKFTRKSIGIKVAAGTSEKISVERKEK
ncbi:MFS transporter, partial [archaeon]